MMCPEQTALGGSTVAYWQTPDLLTERRWLLEGHALKGNDSSYLKITTEDLYNQFMLAHDNLLIDQSHKLRRQVEKLEVEKNSFEQLKGPDSSAGAENQQIIVIWYHSHC